MHRMTNHRPGLVMATALLGVVTNLASAQAGQVALSFQVQSSWSTGFQVVASITNNANWTIFDWQLDVDLPHTITSIWGARVAAQNGTHYVLSAVQASWEDGDLSPQESVSFGFVAQPSSPLQVPTTGTLNGVPVTLNGSSPAPPPLSATTAPPWPNRVFAPYVDATAWPSFPLLATAQSEGLRFFNLAFIVAAGAGNPTPSWGGYYSVASQFLVPEINALRAMGGDVFVSFGGAAGIELAAAATSAAQLQAAYQSVIDAYALTHIDFDIEGIWVADPPSILRRSQAIAGLQAAASAQGRELHVWYTLPVLPTGLTQDGVAVLQSALANGVAIAGVNIMAMDYGPATAPNPNGQMGAYAIQAATSLLNQLRALYLAAGTPKTDPQLWKMIGVTPMIGQNDVAGEVFLPSDAQQLVSFALAQDLGLLAFWSMGRDQPCPGGPSPWASPSCSGIAQAPFQFTQLFLPFTSSTWRNLALGHPGAFGTPLLTGAGALRASTPFTLALSGAAPARPALLVFGLSRIDLPLYGGTLVPSLDATLLLTTDALGAAGFSASWPPGVPPRFPLWYQVAIADPTASAGIAASNGLVSYTP